MTREDIAMHAVALHTGEVAGSIPTAPTIFQHLIGSCRQ
jgi:hypothetical protein